MQGGMGIIFFLGSKGGFYYTKFAGFFTFFLSALQLFCL